MDPDGQKFEPSSEHPMAEPEKPAVPEKPAESLSAE
jgi:hypothetical protein